MLLGALSLTWRDGRSEVNRDEELALELVADAIAKRRRAHLGAAGRGCPEGGRPPGLSHGVPGAAAARVARLGPPRWPSGARRGLRRAGRGRRPPWAGGLCGARCWREAGVELPAPARADAAAQRPGHSRRGHEGGGSLLWQPGRAGRPGRGAGAAQGLRPGRAAVPGAPSTAPCTDVDLWCRARGAGARGAGAAGHWPHALQGADWTDDCRTTWSCPGRRAWWSCTTGRCPASARRWRVGASASGPWRAGGWAGGALPRARGRAGVPGAARHPPPAPAAGLAVRLEAAHRPAPRAGLGRGGAPGGGVGDGRAGLLRAGGGAAGAGRAGAGVAAGAAAARAVAGVGGPAALLGRVAGAGVPGGAQARLVPGQGAAGAGRAPRTARLGASRLWSALGRRGG